jgi:predicted nuclease of predicted toxin-antitoxin system
MKFKIDQNLPAEFVAILAQSGHEGMTVWDQGLGGAPDREIVAACRQEGRIPITADLDISDIRQYPPQESPGFIVLRLKQQTQPNQIALLGRILPLLATAPVAGRLWIAEPGGVRVRGGEA